MGYKFKQHLRVYFMTSVLNVDIVFWIGDVLNRENLGIYFAKFDIYLSKYKTVLIICSLHVMIFIKPSSFFVEFQPKFSIFLVPPPQNEPTIKTSPSFMVVFNCTIKVYIYISHLGGVYISFCPLLGAISYTLYIHIP